MRRPLFRLEWWMPLAVLVPSFALRLFNIAIARPTVDDSTLNVPSAMYFVQSGFLGPDNWWTQPLKHPTLAAFIEVFGYDPIGWRLRGVVFGTLIVLLAFLLARRAFRAQFPAWAAAALVGLDPLLITMSRTTSEELLATSCLLLALIFALRFLDDSRERDVVWTAVWIALAIAFRLYAVVPWAVIVALIVWATWHDERLRGRLWAFGVYLAAIPVAIYVAAYLPWFGRGYSLAEWVDLQVDLVRVQANGFGFANIESIAGAGRWVTEVVKVGGLTGASGGLGAYQLMMNDLLLWALGLVATVYLLWRGWKIRSLQYLAVSGSLIAFYAFVVGSPRPVYLYSAVPFAALALTCLSYGIWRLPRPQRSIALGIAIAWSVYLWPLTSVVPVPSAAYAWLIGALQ